MAKLFLICGLPGSGKTTFGKKFADKNGFDFLSIDDCYEIINGDELIRENKFEVWMHFYKIINTYQTANRDLVIEAMALDRYARHEFISWFPKFEHHLLFMTEDFEICCRNVASRRRTIDVTGMHKLADRLEYPGAEEKKWWSSFSIITRAVTDGRYHYLPINGTKEKLNFELMKGVNE